MSYDDRHQLAKLLQFRIDVASILLTPCGGAGTNVWIIAEIRDAVKRSKESS